MCQPLIYKRAAKRASLSQSLVEGDLEIVGQNGNIFEGPSNGIGAGTIRTRTQNLWLAWPGSGIGWAGISSQ